ncbi:MAG: O-antigen ligase family protein, partial [Candidatus Hodarchaeota archaeon]
TFIKIFLPVKLQFNSSNIAKFSFFVYIFFIIFGTELPFQEKITSLEDISTSNPVNQFVFSFLYILSFIHLVMKKQKVIEFVKSEKFLTLFLFYALCSVFWSDFFFISLKRWLQVFGSVIICLAALLSFSSSDEALRYIRAIFIVYLLLTVLSVIFIPGAIQWEFPAWRGLAPHKNLLGQVALISLMIWIFRLEIPHLRKKAFAFVFAGLSFLVYIGARSTTCLMAGSFLLILILIKISGKILGPPGVDRFFFLTASASFSVIFFSVYFLAPDIFVSFFDLFGKNMTFTGRTDLWDLIFNISKGHLLLGCGFGGFWIMDSPHLTPIFEEFVWLPNTAHMGYLDILNETGIIGIILFALMIIFYFKNSYKYNILHKWQWLFVVVLILNIQETTLFQKNMFTGVIFIISYLASYTHEFKY